MFTGSSPNSLNCTKHQKIAQAPLSKLLCPVQLSHTPETVEGNSSYMMEWYCCICYTNQGRHGHLQQKFQWISEMLEVDRLWMPRGMKSSGRTQGLDPDSTQNSVVTLLASWPWKWGYYVSGWRSSWGFIRFWNHIVSKIKLGIESYMLFVFTIPVTNYKA